MKVDLWTWYERKYLIARDIPEALHHIMRTWMLMMTISLIVMVVSLCCLSLILLH